MTQRSLDHLLVKYYLNGDGTDHHVGADRVKEEPDHSDEIKEALASGLLEGDFDHSRLTSSGQAVARDLVRRYRLAERLLHDLLGVEESELAESACEMEHVLSPKVTDAICTLLGHPPVCPHGRKIPPGSCCREAWQSAPPVVIPLTQCDPGQSGRISFVRGTETAGIDRLADIGLVPGTTIKLVRMQPIPVVQIGEAAIAVENSLASQVFITLETFPVCPIKDLACLREAQVTLA